MKRVWEQTPQFCEKSQMWPSSRCECPNTELNFLITLLNCLSSWKNQLLHTSTDWGCVYDYEIQLDWRTGKVSVNDFSLKVSQCKKAAVLRNWDVIKLHFTVRRDHFCYLWRIFVFNGKLPETDSMMYQINKQ